ncbi:MAG: hypothetical protein ABSD31_05210 [Candidatus Binataceae bacterium]
MNLTRTALLAALVFFFLLLEMDTVLARSWSYHYHPAAPESPEVQPTPLATEQFSKAQLLKNAIVSDLAIYLQGQPSSANKASDEEIAFLTTTLSSFDQMDSPEALAVFASLSGYYLGARGEKLYQCLSLRKGKNLKPYLERYIRSGNPECASRFGQRFSQPSDVLEGHALCASSQQEVAQLTELIAEIDAGRSCSDAELAAMTSDVRHSAAMAR